MSTLKVVPTTSFARHVLAAYLNWVAENKDLIKTYLICDFKQLDAPDWLEESCANDGSIVLDLSPAAIREYHTLLTGVQFEARFKGIAVTITIPWAAMQMVYSINSYGDIQTPVNLADVNAAEIPLERSVKVNAHTTAVRPSGLRLVK